jgi:glycine betaine/choline ABC-type transport system substrate-binding protein
MIKKLATLFLITVLTLLATGCEKAPKPVHIGSKDFTEQRILSEIMAQVIEQAGIPVKRSIPYGDTFLNQEALKRGDIDLYAEYNGTGLVLLGQPPIHNGDQAYARVKELFAPLGLEWQGRFGFSNEYVLLMRSNRALATNTKTISDLLKLTSPPRFAIDSQFLERPLDGYAALLRRYGLVAEEPLVFKEGEKQQIYEALLDDKVDVVEGFSTDGQIADFGLTVLEDDLEFFPVYEPAPLVRQSTLERYPQLVAILDQLKDTMGVDVMREMNKAVELEGRDYKLVARQFLVERQLATTPQDLAKAEELPLAVGLLDEVELGAGKAVRAVRKAFPTRRVTLDRTSEPLQQMLEGKTRLALAGAQAFFELKGVFPEPITTAEALGMVGYRLAHLLTVPGGPDTLTQMKRLGVGPENGASHRTAQMVLTSLGLIDQVELAFDDDFEGQVVALRQGALDGLFLMVEPGHAALTAQMNQGGLQLASIPEWGEGNNLVRFPFLRLARIPAETYKGQAEPLDTLSAQTVLAGPSPQHEAVGSRGPAIIVGARTQPVSDTAILALNKSLEREEKIDPALPAAAVLNPAKASKPGGIEVKPAISFTNLIVILLIIYMIRLFQQEGPRKRKTH